MALNSGPPPNPQARRRNTRPARLQLPAEGRTGSTPPWPLLPDLNLKVRLQMAEDIVEELSAEPELKPAEKRKLDNARRAVIELTYKIENVAAAEIALWEELWATPQSVAWERLHYKREVAQYVRWKVYAEWGDLDAAKEARQLSDRLGLTPMAMLRLQWDVVADETAERRQESRQAEVKKSPRSRLKVVADDAVEGTGTSG